MFRFDPVGIMNMLEAKEVLECIQFAANSRGRGRRKAQVIDEALSAPFGGAPTQKRCRRADSRGIGKDIGGVERCGKEVTRQEPSPFYVPTQSGQRQDPHAAVGVSTKRLAVYGEAEGDFFGNLP